MNEKALDSYFVSPAPTPKHFLKAYVQLLAWSFGSIKLSNLDKIHFSTFINMPVHYVIRGRWLTIIFKINQLTHWCCEVYCI